MINRYKVGKHFVLTIQDGLFQCRRNEESIEREMRLDGIYVVRTSEPATEMSAADTVRQYKSLSEVERAFRCLKGVDLLVRPIRHFTADHVRAAYLSVHAGLLCGMAHEGGAGSAAV
ncbi:MAG: hypothetical protein MZW92_06825 [Comamonadaceae bacterium]|nr:hypothetical protein [Comamonadaceae bacterium]